MKRSIYYVSTKLKNDFYLYYNSFTGKYVVIERERHELFENIDLGVLAHIDKAFYDLLLYNGFIIEDDFNERSIVDYKKLCCKMDSTLYHLVINTTLDCNLHCWYCYENKRTGSELQPDVIEAIKKNIALHYDNQPYKQLKLSFFGGEPFANFRGIKEIVDFSREFCNERNLSLLLDFTTNATLINKRELEYLSSFDCMFQITLDGHKDLHNEIKYWEGHDSYALTVKNIHLISKIIKKSRIWIRINYNNSTLEHFNEILAEFTDLDRTRTFLILRKIWQEKSDEINSKNLLSAISMALKMRFFVDCYALSRGGICFAERMNEAMFNVDGKIFKCSTLSDFNEANSLGKLDKSTGRIDWNISKISNIPLNLRNDKCSRCKLYPSCLGVCNKNIIRKEKRTCVIDEQNLNLSEYLMYNFKLTLMYENV